LELNFNAKPISEDSLTTSAQKLTFCRSVSWISIQTSSFTSTLPPVSTKQPLRLRSVTVPFSRESTPSQRACNLTLARGADLLSFSISVQTGNHVHRARCRDECALPKAQERTFCRAWFSDIRCLPIRRCPASRPPCAPPFLCGASARARSTRRVRAGFLRAETLRNDLRNA